MREEAIYIENWSRLVLRHAALGSVFFAVSVVAPGTVQSQDWRQVFITQMAPEMQGMGGAGVTFPPEALTPLSGGTYPNIRFNTFRMSCEGAPNPHCGARR
jgi:hypothetical protein